ncbi:Universal stress protein [compost metagenome]
MLHVCNGHDGPDVEPAGDAADAMAADTCTVLAAAAAGLTRDYPGLQVHQVLESGRYPATALVRAGVHALLLVIGCKGRGGLNVLVGSVARDVLMDIQCPTLITRPARKH